MKLISRRDLYYLAVIALLRLAARLPAPAKSRLVRAVARVAYHLSLQKRRLIRRTLVGVVDGLDPAELDRIIRLAFRSFWEDLFAWLPNAAERAALVSVDIAGCEYLEAALAAGKGVILWESSRFGRRVLGEQVLSARGYRLHEVHGHGHLGGLGLPDEVPSRVRERFVRPFFDACERQFAADVIYLPASDSMAFTRTLSTRLKADCIVSLPGDGREGQKRLAVQVFGRPELFSTGPLNLARLSGAPVLPLFCYQERSGQRRVVVEAPLVLDPQVGRDSMLEQALAEYAARLESYVRRFPHEYRPLAPAA